MKRFVAALAFASLSTTFFSFRCASESDGGTDGGTHAQDTHVGEQGSGTSDVRFIDGGVDAMTKDTEDGSGRNSDAGTDAEPGQDSSDRGEIPDHDSGDADTVGDSSYDGGFTDVGKGCVPNCPADDMVPVPDGTFQMGCNVLVDQACYSDEYPYHAAHVPTFMIDRYEVTVSDYKLCVNFGVCTDADSGEGCNFDVLDREDHPVNCVDWSQARVFCTWVGKRLPSETEWEKAARGSDGRRYPWGNEFVDCDHAVWCDDDSNEPTSCGCGNGGTMPVGSKPLGESPYGAADMCGNVWEWTEDDYHDTYTDSPADGSPWVESPRGLERVARGGSWSSTYGGILRVTSRNGVAPDHFGHFLGFRCVAGP
ncbi:MAG: formylglycine-generating enzyme family protein [Verrucomicrobia bacterium]|nr:formylglycine-generating enzyme family protein [Verrucomicrobiota bacterium]